MITSFSRPIRTGPTCPTISTRTLQEGADAQRGSTSRRVPSPRHLTLLSAEKYRQPRGTADGRPFSAVAVPDRFGTSGMEQPRLPLAPLIKTAGERRARRSARRTDTHFLRRTHVSSAVEPAWRAAPPFRAPALLRGREAARRRGLLGDRPPGREFRFALGPRVRGLTPIPDGAGGAGATRLVSHALRLRTLERGFSACPRRRSGRALGGEASCARTMTWLSPPSGSKPRGMGEAMCAPAARIAPRPPAAACRRMTTRRTWMDVDLKPIRKELDRTARCARGRGCLSVGGPTRIHVEHVRLVLIEDTGRRADRPQAYESSATCCHATASLDRHRSGTLATGLPPLLVQGY